MPKQKTYVIAKWVFWGICVQMYENKVGKLKFHLNHNLYLYWCNWDWISLCSKHMNIKFQDCFDDHRNISAFFVSEGSYTFISIHAKGLSCLSVIIIWLLWIGHWSIILGLQTNSHLIFTHYTRVYCSLNAYLICVIVLV